MYLKTDILGRKEIMDGNPDEARNDPDAKTSRKNPIVDIYVSQMRKGDPNAQASFAHYAKVYRQALVARAKAGDRSAQEEIATLNRSLPMASKIDVSLLGMVSVKQQQIDAIDYTISLLIENRKNATTPQKQQKIDAIDYGTSLLLEMRKKMLVQT
jgi:hypothetical protein